MKKNIVAIILIFSMLMSFAACRKLEDSGMFVVESKVYVVDENGDEKAVQVAVDSQGVTEYYFYDTSGNRVVVKEKDVIVETTRVPVTTNEYYANLSPEEQSFFDTFNNPDAFEELIDSTVEAPKFEISDELLPEENFDEIEVETDSDGNPIHDDIDQTYEDLAESKKFTMDLNVKSIADGVETSLPIYATFDNDKLYFETAMPVNEGGAMKLNVILKDKNCYLVVPSMRAYMVIPAESLGEFVPTDILDTMEEESTLKYVSSAEVEYNGQTYICDVFEDENATVKRYYKDGELKRVETIQDENNMSIWEVNSISGNVDSSKFNVPKNYMDMTKMFTNGLSMEGLAQ